MLFLCTCVQKVPLSVLVSRTSRKADLMSCSSFVNEIFSVVLLVIMSFILFVFTVANSSSTNFAYNLMSLLSVTALFSRPCITASSRKLESGDHIMCAHHLFIKRVLETEFSGEAEV